MRVDGVSGVPPMTIEELARLVITTLDQQQTYFKSRGTAVAHTELIKSKQLESQLRTAARVVLAEDPK